jgi:hypothetical protein
MLFSNKKYLHFKIYNFSLSSCIKKFVLNSIFQLLLGTYMNQINDLANLEFQFKLRNLNPKFGFKPNQINLY